MKTSTTANRTRGKIIGDTLQQVRHDRQGQLIDRRSHEEQQHDPIHQRSDDPWGVLGESRSAETFSQTELCVDAGDRRHDNFSREETGNNRRNPTHYQQTGRAQGSGQHSGKTLRYWLQDVRPTGKVHGSS